MGRHNLPSLVEICVKFIPFFIFFGQFDQKTKKISCHFQAKKTGQLIFLVTLTKKQKWNELDNG